MSDKRIIYSTPDGGVAVVIPTGEVPIEQLIGKDIPAGADYEVVDVDAVPSDRTFRGAWVKGNGAIDHDIDKCKEIGHNIRREMRTAEFAPYDKVIAAQIPGSDAAKAEFERVQIREKYAFLQETIDLATTPEAIKEALEVAK